MDLLTSSNSYRERIVRFIIMENSKILKESFFYKFIRWMEGIGRGDSKIILDKERRWIYKFRRKHSIISINITNRAIGPTAFLVERYLREGIIKILQDFSWCEYYFIPEWSSLQGRLLTVSPLDSHQPSIVSIFERHDSILKRYYLFKLRRRSTI